MRLSLILTAVLNIFATNVGTPNLCADAYLDATGAPYTDVGGQPLSRYCEWAAPDAPVLNADLCCAFNGDEASCSLPDSKGSCARGTSKMYCEHGIVGRTSVLCYQPLANLCDYSSCQGEIAQPGSGPYEGALCCWSNGTCTEIVNSAHVIACGDHGGWVGWCDDGAQNLDGTVDCFD